MSRLIHGTLLAFTLFTGCAAAEITGADRAPLATFTVEGPEGLSFAVDVLDVERAPGAASYQLTVQGEPYALTVSETEGGATAEVRDASGALALRGERRGDETRVTGGATELQASGAPVEIDVATMEGLDPFALALLTDAAMTALARVQAETAAPDGLGAHTAATISTGGGGGGFIVWLSACTASCTSGSCSVVCDKGKSASCSCGFWGSCNATCSN